MLVDRATAKLKFSWRNFTGLPPGSLRAQRNPPPVTVFGTPALASPCQGAAGGLAVPGEARQVARGGAAEPGCTFKGPVAAGAFLLRSGGCPDTPGTAACEATCAPAPPRPGPPLAPREQSPRPPPNFRGGSGRVCAVCAPPGSPAGRGSASPRPALRPAGSSPPRRPQPGHGGGESPASGRGTGRGQSRAARGRAGQGR